MAACPLLLLMLVCTCIMLVSGSELNSLKVRWGNAFNGYYDLPWSLSEAEASPNGLWKRAGHDRKLHVTLVSHNEDPRFFLLFDRQGTIAGIRFAYDKDDVSRKMLTDERYRYTFPKTMFKNGKSWKKRVWFTSVLFAHPDTIKHVGRTGLVKGVDDVLTDLYYWADRTWRQVPKYECDVTPELTEQGCYNGTGQHYYYRTDELTSCADWQGFFATYDEGHLAGFGLTVFGSFLSTYFTPTYYEYPAFPVVKALLPNRPDCVDEWLPYTGVTSVHVFLTKDAANIVCPQVSWRNAHCPQRAIENQLNRMKRGRVETINV